MSVADMLKAKAEKLRAAKKSGSSVSKKETKKTAKPAAKKNGKTSTPRAESKTAKILELLKSGSTRETIRKKYGMERLADVGWYISKFKKRGLLPQSFKTKD